MTLNKIRSKFSFKMLYGGITAVVLAAFISGICIYKFSQPTISPSLNTYIDPIFESEITEETVPLDSEPVVKVTTSTKTTKKTVTLAAKATRSYIEVLPKQKTSQTCTAVSGSTKIQTDIVNVTTIKEKYTKNSKKKVVTTKVKTTVTTTTQQIEVNTAAPATAAAQKTVSVRSLAPKVPENILSAFETLCFKVVIDPTLQYNGLTSARNQRITMSSTGGTTIYHELGHFVAFLNNYSDESDAFVAIYNKEKDKLTSGYVEYCTSSSIEYFAQSFLDYVLTNADLRKNRPETYAFIENAINVVTEQRVQLYKTTFASTWTFD